MRPTLLLPSGSGCSSNDEGRLRRRPFVTRPADGRPEASPINRGRVTTRDELLQKIWGRREAHRDRTVDVFVRRLRDKIDRIAPRHTFIQTRYGVGYKLEPVEKTRKPEE
jgi:Transcriptional regulatory protein, C terminal